MDVKDLDLRKVENKEKLQENLKQIKPFNKFNNKDVPQSYLEKLIKTICNKYSLKLGSINCDTTSNEKYIIWKISILGVDESRLRGKRDLIVYEYIYGLSIYELLAKTCIYLYNKIKGV